MSSLYNCVKTHTTISKNKKTHTSNYKNKNKNKKNIITRKCNKVNNNQILLGGNQKHAPPPKLPPQTYQKPPPKKEHSPKELTKLREEKPRTAGNQIRTFSGKPLNISVSVALNKMSKVKATDYRNLLFTEKKILWNAQKNAKQNINTILYSNQKPSTFTRFFHKYFKTPQLNPAQENQISEIKRKLNETKLVQRRAKEQIKRAITGTPRNTRHLKVTSSQRNNFI